MSEHNSDLNDAYKEDKAPEENDVNQGSNALDKPNAAQSDDGEALSSVESASELEDGTLAVGEDSKTLEEALNKYGIKLAQDKIAILKEYCELLWTWNERLNLTRHTTFDKFVSRDLVDSMRLANQLQKGEHVLDVGSGGGVPGLVVAILRPDVVVELCEATGKKAEALGAMVDELGLELNVWYAKAEDLLKTRHFHTLTVRAVGKMRSLLLMFAQVWHTFDRILMIKGPNWLAERGEARHYNMFNTLALRKVDEYENPGAEHGSVILQICRKARMEEMEQRAKERAEGKPYSGTIEEIVVDNNPRSGAEPAGKQGLSRHSRGTGARRRQSRSHENASDDANNEHNRRSVKPPKGWTGKKREFKGMGDLLEKSGRTPSASRKSQFKGSNSSNLKGQTGSAPDKGKRGGGSAGSSHNNSQK